MAVGRFLGLWVRFAAASALAGALFLAGGWALDALWPAEDEGLSPILQTFRAVEDWLFSLLVGFVVVAFDRQIVQATPPFLRWGGLALMMLPPARMGLAGQWDWGRLIDAEILWLATLLAFALLARPCLAPGPRVGAPAQQRRSP
jgi:hypothetical protein